MQTVNVELFIEH